MVRNKNTASLMPTNINRRLCIKKTIIVNLVVNYCQFENNLVNKNTASPMPTKIN